MSDGIDYGLVFDDGQSLAHAYDIFREMLFSEMPNVANAEKVVNVLFSIIVLGILDREAALDVLGCPPSVLDSYLREISNRAFLDELEKIIASLASGGSIGGARSHLESLLVSSDGEVAC